MKRWRRWISKRFLDLTYWRFEYKSRDPIWLANTVRRVAPHLAQAAKLLAQSHGAHRGANRVIAAHHGSNPDPEFVVNIFQHDSMAMAVIRLCAMLERCQQIVSFQFIYHALKVRGVIDELTRLEQAASEPELADMIKQGVLIGAQRYADIYVELFDPTLNLISKLRQFRNLVLAHLSEKTPRQPLKFGELDFIAQKVLALAIEMASFSPTGALLHDNEIEIYLVRAEAAMLKAVSS